MKSWTALPVGSLEPRGAISSSFIARGVTDFREAGCHLYQLPYGRNADRSDFTLVLSEGRGTCSTKHALLAALAHEQQIPLLLELGIYEMNEAKTPGVGVVLERYGLICIPEAHCYLSWQSERIDVTRSGVELTASPEPFLVEEGIAPQQIGQYKLEWHQRFMQTWLASRRASLNLSFEDMWRVREECIAALEQWDRVHLIEARNPNDSIKNNLGAL